MKEILEELRNEPVVNKIKKYQSNWLNHVSRMENAENGIRKVLETNLGLDMNGRACSQNGGR